MVNLLGESSLFVEKGNCISVYPNRSHDFIFLRGFGSSDIKGICNGKSAFHFKKHFINLKSNSKDATEKTSLQHNYGYVSRYDLSQSLIVEGKLSLFSSFAALKHLNSIHKMGLSRLFF